jgi:mannose-6-phosphate isomerase-like protein (cupin superfamily)
VRRFVAGVNAEGRSCIVDEGDVTPGSIEGIVGLRTSSLWSIEGSGPPAPPPQHGDHVDVGLAPGALRWIVVDHEPPKKDEPHGVSRRMHHQDAVELVFVLDGSTRLLLDDDERDLVPGDCVVQPGVNHAFADGADGCRMLVVVVGTPPAQ